MDRVMTIQVKICGMTTKEAVASAEAGGADFLGFVFFPLSPRYVTPQKAQKLCQSIKHCTRTVALFVDPSIEEIRAVIEHFVPDYIQLHGNESIERIEEIKQVFMIPIIKAIPVYSSDDVAKGVTYAEHVDMLLFDTKLRNTPVPGGSGKSFDWTLLKERQFSVPWFLAGGINSGNVAKAVEITHTSMVDVSSSLESEPGVKDSGLIRAFLKEVKCL